jgi:hypothetical protein
MGRRQIYEPSGKIIDIADQHIELATTFRCETSMHLNIHCISNLSKLPNWGPTLFLKLLQYGYGASPLSGAYHPVAHHQRRRGTDSGGTNNRSSNRDLPHQSPQRLKQSKSTKSETLSLMKETQMAQIMGNLEIPVHVHGKKMTVVLGVG